MFNRVFVSIRSVAKHFVLLSIATVLLLGLLQPAAHAATADVTADPSAQMDSSESLEGMRARRRAEQSEASKAANTEVKADSLGEVFGEKLNLEEISEKNVTADDARKTLDINK